MEQNKKIRVFLDDIRQPQDCINYMKSRIGDKSDIYMEDWIIVRNYQEFKEIINKYKGNISHISFDHDLAEQHYDPSTWEESFKYEEETGLDCAKWLKEFYKEKGLELPRILIHSMNPVGCENIKNVFS